MPQEVQLSYDDMEALTMDRQRKIVAALLALAVAHRAEGGDPHAHAHVAEDYNYFLTAGILE